MIRRVWMDGRPAGSGKMLRCGRIEIAGSPTMRLSVRLIWMISSRRPRYRVAIPIGLPIPVHPPKYGRSIAHKGVTIGVLSRVMLLM